MTAPAYTLTNESVTVIHEGKPHTIQKGMTQFHVLREAIMSAIQTDNWYPVIESLTVAGSLMQYLGDRWSVDGSRSIKFEGNPVPQSIVDRIWRMANVGESPQPLFRFYERLSKNPSRRSVTQLFDFLKHSNIPLEEDGKFLAYKGVREDFKDKYTGTVDNHPGAVNKMDRNLVSDDPNEACHYGYHVGALSYAGTFAPGGQMIICRVDPEHVVCVPYDYSHQKMRVCEYEVIGMYSGTPMESDVHREELVADEEGEWKEDDEDEVDDEEEVESLAKNVLGKDYDEDDQADIAEPDLTNNAVQAVGHIVKALKENEDKAAKNKAANFRRMDAKKLMNQSIGDLRAYAGHTLKIVGASKIPGGKSALISKILKVRRKK
jgi:hypothetical protein